MWEWRIAVCLYLWGKEVLSDTDQMIFYCAHDVCPIKIEEVISKKLRSKGNEVKQISLYGERLSSCGEVVAALFNVFLHHNYIIPWYVQLYYTFILFCFLVSVGVEVVVDDGYAVVI